MLSHGQSPGECSLSIFEGFLPCPAGDHFFPCALQALSHLPTHFVTSGFPVAGTKGGGGHSECKWPNAGFTAISLAITDGLAVGKLAWRNSQRIA